MLRLAQPRDVPTIAQGLLALRQQTGWKFYNHDGYTCDSLSAFVHDQLANPLTVCYVWEDDTHRVSAFCGATLSRYMLPPHMPMVLEWGWFGQGRAAANCWMACKRWAKKRGAEIAYRALTAPVGNKKRIRESVTWEVL